MQSLKELYKVGKGPSSSHTIGPEKICNFVKEKYPNGYTFKVVLYGSLALTGKGHGTDRVIREVLQNVEIKFDTETKNLPHPNTMEVFIYNGKEQVASVRALSVGGGSVKIDGVEFKEPEDIYKEKNFNEIKAFVLEKGIRLCDYAYMHEPDLKEYLLKVWQVMKACVQSGLSKEGVLPGGLNIRKKAKHLYSQGGRKELGELKRNRLISSYALAVAEENADNGTIVTAPTCGASGVLPAILYYYHKDVGFSEEEIIDALATAGVIGNVIKTNASISGAECGCQAEIGSACSMAAIAICELYALSVDQIECATEVAMEHNLGLTCDPVCGLVQVPCIERNTMSALRAISAFGIAYYLADMRKMSFDAIVRTMYETGKDLNSKYLETSIGGIAKNYGKI
jgi:L-serine dehydratase